MKNLVFASALVLGTLGTVTATEITPIFHDGIMESIFIQDFTEIKTDLLPEAVTAALEKDFPGATIKKAYINGETQYKLEVTNGEEKLVLYADAEGNWIEM
jgi:predicted peptidase